MYSLFFIEGVFKSHLTKITPTQSANSHPKSQFDQSPYYINVLKNGSAPPSPREGGWEWGWVVRTKNIVSTCWWEESCLRKNSVVIASHIFQNNYFKYLLPGVALSTSPLHLESNGWIIWSKMISYLLIDNQKSFVKAVSKNALFKGSVLNSSDSDS